jgi:hypothetical protein
MTSGKEVCGRPPSAHRRVMTHATLYMYPSRVIRTHPGRAGTGGGPAPPRQVPIRGPRKPERGQPMPRPEGRCNNRQF